MPQTSMNINRLDIPGKRDAVNPKVSVPFSISSSLEHHCNISHCTAVEEDLRMPCHLDETMPDSSRNPENGSTLYLIVPVTCYVIIRYYRDMSLLTNRICPSENVSVNYKNI